MRNKNNKEEIIFNKTKYVTCLPKEKTEQELKNFLVEECLSTGYLPIDIEYKKIRRFAMERLEREEYDIAVCYCSYVGKKQSYILYNKLKN